MHASAVHFDIAPRVIRQPVISTNPRANQRQNWLPDRPSPKLSGAIHQTRATGQYKLTPIRRILIESFHQRLIKHLHGGRNDHLQIVWPRTIGVNYFDLQSQSRQRAYHICSHFG